MWQRQVSTTRSSPPFKSRRDLLHRLPRQPNTDCDSDTDTYTNSNRDGDGHCNRNANRYCNSYGYCHGDGDSHRDVDLHAACRSERTDPKQYNFQQL